MSQWTPHKLAGEPLDALVLKPGQRCRSKVDLPGVPAGTEGKVTVANGFSWLRYWVRFDNGVEVGSLDARQLELIPKKKRSWA